MTHVCKICGLVFSRHDALSRHWKTVHHTKNAESFSDDTTEEEEEEEESDRDTEQEDDTDSSSKNTTSPGGLSKSSISLILHALHNADVGVHRLTLEDLRKLVEGVDPETDDGETSDSNDDDASESYSEADENENADEMSVDSTNDNNKLNANQLEYLLAVVKAGKRNVIQLTRERLLSAIDALV